MLGKASGVNDIDGDVNVKLNLSRRATFYRAGRRGPRRCALAPTAAAGLLPGGSSNFILVRMGYDAAAMRSIDDGPMHAGGNRGRAGSRHSLRPFQASPGGLLTRGDGKPTPGETQSACARTIHTGLALARTMLCATLPITSRFRPERPWLVSTTIEPGWASA